MCRNGFRSCAPSQMRTMSRTPCFSSFFGIGRLPHSGMPGAPTGPALRSTSTLSSVTVEIGIVDRTVHLRRAVEHDGRADVLAGIAGWRRRIS